jgi:hypothetical protein
MVESGSGPISSRPRAYQAFADTPGGAVPDVAVEQVSEAISCQYVRLGARMPRNGIQNQFARHILCPHGWAR